MNRTIGGTNRYLTGVLCGLAAVGLRLAFLQSLMGAKAPYTTLYPAVVLAALYGGFWPGLLAALVAAPLASYFWIEPFGRFGIMAWGDRIGMGIFLLTSLLICAAIERMHRAQARVRQAEVQARLGTGPLSGIGWRVGEKIFAVQRLHALLPVKWAAAGALALLVGIGLLNYRNFAALREADRWESHTHMVLEQFDQLLSAAQDAETGQRGYLITGDERYLGPYESARSRLEQILAGLKALTRDNPLQQRRLEGMQRPLALELAELKGTIALRRTGREPARRAVLSGAGKAYMDEIRQLVSQAQVEERRLLAERSDQKAARARLAVASLVGGGLFALGLLVAVLLLLRQEIAQRSRLNEELLAYRDWLEQAVGERTERLRQLAAIVESSDDAILAKTLDGIITSWNHGAELLYGYTAAEAIGQPVAMLAPEDRREEMRRMLEKIKAGERVKHYETVRRAKDGRLIPVSLTISPVLDESGRPVGASTSARDIAERKKIEAALHRNLQILSDTGRMAKVGGWELDLVSGAMSWTEEVFRIHGVPPGDDVPKLAEALDFYPPESRPVIEAAVQKAGRTGEPYDVEVLFLPRGGREKIWVRAIGRAVRDQEGWIVKLVGTFQDIDERKKAEEAMRQSEQRFRTLADAIPQLAWTAKPDGWIYWYNQRWYEYTGTTPEQMEGWGWQRVHDPATLPAVMERWKASIATGQPFDMTFPLRGADGVFRPFLTRVRPLKDDRGRVLQWFGTNTDISEQKRMEEEVRQLNAQLEERVAQRTAQLQASNQELEAFSYSVSHDLRAPLRAMDGFSQALMEDYADQLDAQGRDYLSRVRGGAQRMAQLIEDVIKLSRVSRTEMSHQTVDLSALAQEIASELRQREPQRQVQLKIEPGLLAQADPALMRILLDNLLGNAWKFTSKLPQARIEVGAKTIEGQRTLFVRDNGAGFDAARVDKLFGAFQRLHSAAQFPGTGIGLATVRRIINRHGGRVWAEGAVGQGATFYFTLPSRVNQEAACQT